MIADRQSQPANEAVQESDVSPSYGVSDHYLGDRGEQYYSSQGQAGEFKARIHRHVFAPFVKPTDVVLDFGCGGGFNLRALDCARRIGVEINPHARSFATKIGIECYQEVAAVSNYVADVVISNHALEHVPFPIGALRELRTKLKPSGRLVLCVPIDNWKKQRSYDPNNRDHHLHTWTSQLLGNTLYEAGYEIESVKVWPHRWPGRWTVASYGRLPYWMFVAICYAYSVLSGDGRNLFALARPGKNAS